MTPPHLTKQQYQDLLRRAEKSEPVGFPVEYVVLPTALAIYLVSAWSVARTPWSIGLVAPCTGLAMLLLSIIQHECAHDSLFRSKWVNRCVGFVCSLLTFLPHAGFVRGHRAHHLYLGNPDHKDPTEAKLVANSALLRVLLKIRVVPFLFLFGVYFPYFFYDYFPTDSSRKKSHIAGTLLAFGVIMLFHIAVSLFLNVGAFYWVFTLFSFICFGILYEHLFTQNQHAGLQPTPGKNIYRYREQGNFSRSVRIPLANWLLYFNLHKEHHLFPQVNYRLLPQLNGWIETEQQQVANYTSSDLGWVRRRNYDDLFELKSGDGMQGFDWICANLQATLPHEPHFASWSAFLQKCTTQHDAPAFVGLHGNEILEWSVSDLERFSRQVKNWLPQLNLKPGDTVALVRPEKESEFLLAVLTFALIGSGIHAALADADIQNLQRVIDERQVQAIMIIDSHCESSGALESSKSVAQIECANRTKKLADSQRIPFIVTPELDSFYRLQNDDHEQDTCEIDGELILFSSGTLGRPEMTCYSMESIVKSAQSFELAKIFDQGMRGNSICFSFAHTTGIRTVIQSMWNGSKVLLIPRELLLAQSWDAMDLIMQFPPSHITCAPGLLARILKIVDKFPGLQSILDGLDCIHSIGAEFVANLSSRFRQRLHNAFGMTETQQVTSTLVSREQCKILQDRGKPAVTATSSIGKPLTQPLGYPLAGVSIAVRMESQEQRIGELYIQTEIGSLSTRQESSPVSTGQPSWFPTGDLVQLVGDEVYYYARKRTRQVANGLGENLDTSFLEKSFADRTGLKLVCFDGGIHEGIVGIVFTKASNLLPSEQIINQLGDAVLDWAQPSGGKRLPFNDLSQVALVPAPCPITPVGKIDFPQILEDYADMIQDLQSGVARDEFYALALSR